MSVYLDRSTKGTSSEGKGVGGRRHWIWRLDMWIDGKRLRQRSKDQSKLLRIQESIRASRMSYDEAREYLGKDWGEYDPPITPSVKKTEVPVSDNTGILTAPSQNEKKTSCRGNEAEKANRTAYQTVNREAIKEKAAAYRATYRAKNKEKIAAYSAKYYAANKDKILAASVEWRKANKNKRAVTNATYNAKKQAEKSEAKAAEAAKKAAIKAAEAAKKAEVKAAEAAKKAEAKAAEAAKKAETKAAEAAKKVEAKVSVQVEYSTVHAAAVKALEEYKQFEIELRKRCAAERKATPPIDALAYKGLLTYNPLKLEDIRYTGYEESRQFLKDYPKPQKRSHPTVPPKPPKPPETPKLTRDEEKAKRAEYIESWLAVDLNAPKLPEGLEIIREGVQVVKDGITHTCTVKMFPVGKTSYAVMYMTDSGDTLHRESFNKYNARELFSVVDIDHELAKEAESKREKNPLKLDYDYVYCGALLGKVYGNGGSILYLCRRIKSGMGGCTIRQSPDLSEKYAQSIPVFIDEWLLYSQQFDHIRVVFKDGAYRQADQYVLENKRYRLVAS